MYDELVRCLRGHSQKMGCADNCICDDAYKRGFATCSEELAKLAADAIEELSRENKEIMFRANQLEAINDALIKDDEEQAKEESEQIYKAYDSKAVKTGIKAFPEPPSEEGE